MNAVLAQPARHDAWLEPLFDVAFAAPGGIARLRQLILTLAMQGKLVPQLASEVPASELLKQIADEKTALVKAGKIRQSRPLDPIDDAEKSHVLPHGWRRVRFGDFAYEIATGPFGTMIHKSDYVSNGVPLINPSHMVDGAIVADPNVSISKQAAKEFSSYRLNDGDMVIARRGEMGRCAIVTEAEDGYLCGTGSFAIRFKREVSRRYILFLFKTNEVRSYLGGNSIGTTMVNLNQGILERMPFLLPPIEEQMRIVARIDELMTRCDELEYLRQQQAGKRAAARAATMRQWLTGDEAAAKLFGEHFTTLISTREDVAELRKAVLQLAVMGKLVAHARPTPNEPLKELASKIGSGSTPAGGKEAYQKSGIPLIRSMNVHFDGFKHDGLAFINDAQAAKLNSVIVQAGDVLLNITGASIGRVTIAPDEMSGARVNQHVCIIRPTEKVDSRYLQACLASPFTQERIFDVQVGATREALTKGMIEKFQIPLPPLPEQKRIVARIDELMQLCDMLGSRIEEAEEKQVELLNAVMARA